jgi:PAS domain S-box-containing protein
MKKDGALKRKNSALLYRSLFENMLDGLAYCQMIFDAQGRPIDFIYRRVNRRFEILTGLKNPTGKRVTALIPGIYESNPELLLAYGNVAATGKPNRFETYIKALDKWFFISAYSVKKNYFVAIFQNISDQKRSEQDLENANIAAQNVLEDLNVEKMRYEALASDLEKFKLAVDNASDSIMITDPKGIVIYANKAAQTITGYAREEVVGQKSRTFEKTPMTSAYYGPLWAAINHKKVFAGEIQNMRKNGLAYTASISVSPILDKKGRVEFLVAIEHDITREKEIENAKSEFVSLASHQLRTPPSIIGWYTETLQSGDLGPVNQKQAAYLDEIYRANQRMIAVVNALLNISRIEMGSFVISPKNVDLKILIDDITKELNMRFNRDVAIQKVYDPSLGLFRTDPNIMGIIIENLLSNAIKYSPPENTRIGISLKKENGSLLLSVTNHGIGIPVKDRARVFEKLFRADNAVATNPDGTGIGLYMVKKIIAEGLGGKIWFSSTENGDTTFFVSLPGSGMKEKPGTTTLVRVK